ncbi:hypothetical protein CC1G_02868 [Coprinopsis cinerea okayama7|uniref:Aminotransferase class I/classII domain-containing protein n=1 Tax=Coprinopsis cinerea (strain Okayama-7 / 130 / ATCC MYA-4618 / FGSC 9003) TaxID=240176 RepID=A8N099_COPC7|nr:hypothetical protein CC1G_02868 [Coprinopsis cinerea okayama7\|eukprot:XP_001828287.1 hypothetical protein CC1G_02868 [Coprinopsis cinerea okayama7\
MREPWCFVSGEESIVHAADNQHASSDGAGFHSVLSVDAEADAGCDPSRIVALWSASKDFGATSARLAVAVIPQNDLLKAALSSLSFSFRISSLADCFFSTFLSAKSSYLPKPSSGSEEKSLVDVYLIENSARLRNAKRHLSDWCLSKNIQVLDSNFGAH